MSGRTESRYRDARDRVRGFNKRVLNPFALRLAGRPLVPYGVVRHVGRRSGREYDTPVLVAEVGDQFVVPLPYGTDVDWYQNVRSADECIVVYDGHAYRAESPRLVDPAAVPEAFPDWQGRMVQETGANQYLRMDRGAEVPDVYRETAEKYPAEPAVAGLAGAALAVAVLWRAARRSA